jgi:hypothetical protein
MPVTGAHDFLFVVSIVVFDSLQSIGNASITKLGMFTLPFLWFVVLGITEEGGVYTDNSRTAMQYGMIHVCKSAAIKPKHRDQNWGDGQALSTQLVAAKRDQGDSRTLSFALQDRAQRLQ